MVYLGISFRFQYGSDSKAYIAWYLVGLGEIIIELGISLVFKALSFSGTHLCERLNLLTIIILGEGHYTQGVNSLMHSTNIGTDHIDRYHSHCEVHHYYREER